MIFDIFSGTCLTTELLKTKLCRLHTLYMNVSHEFSKSFIYILRTKVGLK